ncbi:MAG: rhodanese-like domain-containing protein [Patescibacteria group bacterium]
MTNQESKKITCEHLQKLRTGELEHIVLDVRDEADFETGHITDSIHVPARELETNLPNLLTNKERKVVVVVGPTQEAEIERLHEQLAGLGYSNVEFLAGGIDRWCEIAPLEIEPELVELTPEESGFVGDELNEIDPEGKDNEPLM